MSKGRIIEKGHIMTVDEVRASAIRASARAAEAAGIEARAQGTVMALTGEGDPSWHDKLQRRVAADIQTENDPRGNFAQSGAAEIKRK